MNAHKISFLTALLFFVFAVSTTDVLAKDEWVKVRSKNFQLIGNAAEKDIRRVASKLEQFRETFRQIFTRVNFASPVPINVVVFKNDKSFRDFKPIGKDGKRTDWVAGYFQKSEAANYIVLSTEGEMNFTYRVIFHEYIHFLVDNDIGRSNVPPWFNEGLAEYYEQFKIENDQKVTLGGLNEQHLVLLQQNKLIAFETFFNVDNYSLQRQGHNSAGLFYAQAWALIHYLMHGNGGVRLPQLDKFTTLVINGKTPKAAFAEAFQTDYATMERELKKYVEQRSFRVSQATFKDKLIFDAEIQSAPASEAEAKTVLGDLLYQSDRLPEAAAMLEAALKLDADSGLANITLGLVKMKQKDFAAAEKLLEKAVARDDKNFLAHYYYAYGLSRKGMTDFGFVSNYNAELAEEMRESLRKSIALNPNFPESYNLYAFISVVRNEEIDQAIAYLGKATKLAPGNQWYQMRVAELYMRKEDFSRARKLAQKIYETAPDDQLRVYAKNAINLINSYESQLESVRNYNNRAKQEIVTDKPLTDEEIARLNEEAMLEAINQTLRKPKTDETRGLGFITKIECGAKGIEYWARIDDRLLQFTSETFDSLFLMSFDGKLSNDEFGCGTVKKDMYAVITYRPTDAAKTRTAGEIVAVEFVPKNFKFVKH